MPYESENLITIAEIEFETISSTEIFSEILDKKGIEYQRDGYYLQVGQINKNQGWILDISVVKWQVASLLQRVLPLLIQTKTTFSVAQDKETAKNILEGTLGYYKVGKVLTIYPENDEIAISLAEKLIDITKVFKGPSILSDEHLGSCVYTRYGAFQPIQIIKEDGRVGNFIYDYRGSLVEDVYSSPFKLPFGISWPFNKIKQLMPSQDKNTLRGKYKPINCLKSDAKGNVYKAVYLKKLFLPSICVIKQGRQNMWSDESDRDMISRLQWQKIIHERLAEKVPLPKVIDHFCDGGDSYLIIEYIPGPSLMEKIFEINNNCDIWANLSDDKKKQILNYLSQIIDILVNLHSEGFIHRDLTPVNFLVSKNERLYLIDNELVYDNINKIPNPVFEAGTVGFMSPQQVYLQSPTPNDDIYSLAATIITIITTLSPFQTVSGNPTEIMRRLDLFLQNSTFTQILVNSLNYNPAKRATLLDIKLGIADYQKSILQKHINKKGFPLHIPEFTETDLRSVIDRAIKGLVSPPTAISDGLWYSRSQKNDSMPGKEISEFEKLPGLFEGIAGILYFLSRAHTVGINISECKESFENGWHYIKSTYLQHIDKLPPGLYNGSAGIALALGSSLTAGLIEKSEENKLIIAQCLENKATSLDFSSGISGQGIAAIQCKRYLSNEQFKSRMSSFVKDIQSTVNKRGFWILLHEKNGKKRNAVSFSHGNTGIVYFLLESYILEPTSELEVLLNYSLKSCQYEAQRTISKYSKKGCRILLNDDPRVFDGLQGLILIFTKAYQIFKIEQFKNISERLLSLYSPYIVHSNITSYNGLSGIGELYIYAYTVFANSEWLDRAKWIAALLMQFSQPGEANSIFWLGNNSIYTTADLMTGNSGIIDFLINLLFVGKPGFRILN